MVKCSGNEHNGRTAEVGEEVEPDVEKAFHPQEMHQRYKKSEI